MKLIKAFIRHRKTEQVYNAIKNGGYCCMTIVEYDGTGQYSDYEKDHINDN